MIFDVKCLADVLYNLGRCGSSKADDALGLDLLNETGN